MDFQEAIIKFLGIQDVNIEGIQFLSKSMKAVVTLRQERRECFCSRCGLQFDSVKEWQKKSLKGPSLGIYSDGEIIFYQLRGHCEDCSHTKMAEASCIHPKFKSMTCSYVEVAGRLMEEITCEAVSRILHTDSMTLWKVDQWRMEFMESRLKLPDNLDVSHLAADEVHFHTVENTNRKGLFAKRHTPEFVTNLVSPKYGKVLANALAEAVSLWRVVF